MDRLLGEICANAHGSRRYIHGNLKATNGLEFLKHRVDQVEEMFHWMSTVMSLPKPLMDAPYYGSGNGQRFPSDLIVDTRNLASRTGYSWPV